MGSVVAGSATKSRSKEPEAGEPEEAPDSEAVSASAAEDELVAVNNGGGEAAEGGDTAPLMARDALNATMSDVVG